MIDLEPAAQRTAGIVAGVRDNQLGNPTPCPGRTVGDLIDHVGLLAQGFTASAEKRRDSAGGPPPPPDAANLGSDWRNDIAVDLGTLAMAWRDPAAWEGMTSAGGMDFPANVVGVITLDELLVHGWDLAVATGQAYDATDDEIVAATAFVSDFHAPRDGSLFGPVVPVATDARALDRLLGLTGRDPAWTAGAQSGAAPA
jgi:uncharacterized protein (TIGR03086 family)